jgi:rhodanese-related sulfurtransferase
MKNLVKDFFKIGVFQIAVAISASTVMASEPVSTDHPELQIKHVDAQQAQKLVADKKVEVLDIRTPGEFKQGRIAGAKNIDFQAPDFEQRIEALDKSKSYLVHCASGGRSTHSLAVFNKHDFQSVYHLDGGIKAWQKAGLPVEK